MSDGKDVVSLDEYRELARERNPVAAELRATRTADLESRCLSSFYSEEGRYDLVAAAELYRRDHGHPWGLVGKAIIAANAGSYSKCMSTLDCADVDCPGNREIVMTRAMLYLQMMDHHEFRSEDAKRFVRGATGIYFDDPDMMEQLLKVSIFVLRDSELSMQIFNTMPCTSEEEREFYKVHIGLLVGELEEDAAEAAETAKAAKPAGSAESAGVPLSGAPYLTLVK